MPQLLHARVNATADGDNTVIAAPAAGQAIVIVGYNVQSTTAATFIMRSGAAGTIHASYAATANQQFNYAGQRASPAFVLDAAAAFVINTTAGQDILGHVTYYILV